jgi:dihydrofolate reductase
MQMCCDWSSTHTTSTGRSLSRAQAAAAGCNVIVMGGGDLLRQYLAAGLVDEFTLTNAPVLPEPASAYSTGSREPTSPSSRPQ